MHKINVRLDPKSIKSAKEDLIRYRREVKQKETLLREKAVEFLRDEIERGFNVAVIDDLVSGGFKRKADVSVSVRHEGSTSIISANGEDAIWVEFGAGVHHNGSVGSSKHPKGVELGYTIGNYGYGLGRMEFWHYKDGSDDIATYGTPMQMPMYQAIGKLYAEIPKLAREVFNSD